MEDSPPRSASSQDNVETSSPAQEIQHPMAVSSPAREIEETEIFSSPAREMDPVNVPSPASEIEETDIFSSPAGEMDPVNFPSPATKAIATRKHGGWKAMPYILGSIAFERLASTTLTSNLMAFLIVHMHMELASATKLIFIWSGATHFARSVGGLICESFIGSRFLTVAFASLASLSGMVIMALIPAIPILHPPNCSYTTLDQCMGPTTFQLSILIVALGLLTVGTGGTRSCSLPFGFDQFDRATEDGRDYVNTSCYFHWYYITSTVVIAVAYTALIYIQQELSWVIGFAIPATLMLCSCIIFSAGTRIYIYVTPEGNFFTDIAQVLVASYKKRHLELPVKELIKETLYDPPPGRRSIVAKLPLTYQMSFLNKAAIVSSGDINPNGTRRNPWRLATIQQVEELKCLFKILPVLVSGIIFSLVIRQQETLTSSQMLKMDRQLGPKFQVPPGSISVISMVTIMIFVPFYTRMFVPTLRKITKIDSGVTLLQRMGIGMVLSVFSVVVAGVVEKIRRQSTMFSARSDDMAPVSVLWVAPQFILMALAKAFNVISQMEFYFNELPESMRTVSSSLICLSSSGGSYISSLLISIIRRHSHPDWLTRNVNEGRLDLYYYVIGTIGVLNLVYFLIMSGKYEYRNTNSEMRDKKSEEVVEV